MKVYKFMCSLLFVCFIFGFTYLPPVFSWLQISPLPYVSNESAVAVTNTFAYLVAGDGQDKVYYANLNQLNLDSWIQTTSLPQSRKSHQTVINNGYIYVIGGYQITDPQQTVLYASLQGDGSVGIWSATTPLPYDLYRFSAISYGNYVYVFGGWSDSNGGAQTQVFRALVNGDGSLGIWEAQQSLIELSHAHSTAVTSNGFVYLTGGLIGLSGDSAKTVVYRTQILPDGSLSSWQAMSTLPYPIHSHSTIIWNGYLAIMGGRSTLPIDTTNTAVATIKTDNSLGIWTMDTPLPLAKAFHVAFTGPTHIYLLGGSFSSDVFRSPSNPTSISTNYIKLSPLKTSLNSSMLVFGFIWLALLVISFRCLGFSYKR